MGRGPHVRGGVRGIWLMRDDNNCEKGSQFRRTSLELRGRLPNQQGSRIVLTAGQAPAVAFFF